MIDPADPSSQLPVKKQWSALIGAQGEDFSGLDFTEKVVEGQNFFESIFNGCVFRGVRASQSIFQHAEFTETVFNKCRFEDTSFDHSDFVLSDIRDSQFIRCSFQNAEWRDAAFTRVAFRQCIFRNTTTSLSHFRGCSFDKASASSFIGKSKRFSLFSLTDFDLPQSHVEFLQTNFGPRSGFRLSDIPARTRNPFFDLSYLQYVDALTSRDFYDLFDEALRDVTSGGITSNRLRLKYLVEICKLCIEESSLSIFGMQLLERKLSEEARHLTDRNYLLEMFGLIVALNATITERISSIESEVENLKQIGSARLRLNMVFERDYDRPAVERYLNLLGAYCGIEPADIRIASLAKGSTLVEVLIMVPALVLEVFRFFRYSLSLAAVTVTQAGKFKTAISDLVADRPQESKPQLPSSPALEQRPVNQLVPKVHPVSSAVPTEEAARIQIFVDTVKEQVLLVDGKVQITISMA